MSAVENASACRTHASMPSPTYPLRQEHVAGLPITFEQTASWWQGFASLMRKAFASSFPHSSMSTAPMKSAGNMVPGIDTMK